MQYRNLIKGGLKTDTEDYDDDDDYEDFDELPGIFIPCETLETLQQLVFLLFDEEVIDSETPFILKNVPDNILEILNNPEYFDPVEVCGIEVPKGELKLLEKVRNDLL